jgi:hypothetical protein
MITRIVVFASLLAFASPQLHAQRLVPSFHSISIPAPAPTRAQDVAASSGDYRMTGAIFGGVLGGVTGAIIAAGTCRSPDGQAGTNCGGRTLTGAAVGAVSGAVLGYVVGMFIQKS